jgi:hypothetical protein
MFIPRLKCQTDEVVVEEKKLPHDFRNLKYSLDMMLVDEGSHTDLVQEPHRTLHALEFEANMLLNAGDAERGNKVLKKLKHIQRRIAFSSATEHLLKVGEDRHSPPTTAHINRHYWPRANADAALSPPRPLRRRW